MIPPGKWRVYPLEQQLQICHDSQRMEAFPIYPSCFGARNVASTGEKSRWEKQLKDLEASKAQAREAAQTSELHLKDRSASQDVSIASCVWTSMPNMIRTC